MIILKEADNFFYNKNISFVLKHDKQRRDEWLNSLCYSILYNTLLVFNESSRSLYPCFLETYKFVFDRLFTSSVYWTVFNAEEFRSILGILWKFNLNLMAWQTSYITVMIIISRVFYITSHECGTDIYSFYQMMLKGHTFKSFPVRPGSLDCREACLADSRCQSYNVVFKGICELNNRTREARPENFVRNQERYYMKKSSKRGMKIA